MADNGQLICVLAGPASEVERVKPYCKGVMGRAIIDLSGQPQGKATLLKIIGNTFIINMVETLSEGHTLAEKSGLGNENLHQFVQTMFPGPYTVYSGRLMGGDYHKRDEVFLHQQGSCSEFADHIKSSPYSGLIWHEKMPSML